MGSIFIPSIFIIGLKVIVEDIFDIGIFELKTTYFIEGIFSDIFGLLLIEKYSNLNVVGTCGPDIKVLNIAQLINKEWRFADL